MTYSNFAVSHRIEFAYRDNKKTKMRKVLRCKRFCDNYFQNFYSTCCIKNVLYVFPHF